MVRKCSHCGNVGHNSRTCTIHKQKLRGRFKLFGVQLIDEASSSPPPPPSPSADAATASLLKKSISLDCLPSSSLSSLSSLSSPSLSASFEKLSSGYLSDGLVTKTQERKKGVPWSEEEHRVFLVGLEKLGKGDWRGISRKFVTTRTPTQVASHAQKYFLRLTTLNKRKQRRTSLFDAAAGRDKLTVQVIDEGSNLRPTNLQPSSIYFGVIPSKKKPSNSTPIIQNIAKSNGSHSGIFALNINNNKNHSYNSVLPINWFGYEDQPSFKFLQGPIIKSSSSIINGKQKKLSHLQAPDLQLQLSLSTPKPAEQAEPCCRSLAINGAISVT